jgi:hypothetical protein
MKLAHVVIESQKFDTTLKTRFGYTSSGVASVFIENQEVCDLLSYPRYFHNGSAWNSMPHSVDFKRLGN